MKKYIYSIIFIMSFILMLILTKNNSSTNFKTIIYSYYNNKLKNLSNNLIIINFWSTWCNICLSDLKNNIKLAKKYKNNIIFIGLSIDDNYKDINNIIKLFNIKYNIGIINLNATKKFHINSLPANYFFNLNGKITPIKYGKIMELNLSKMLY